MRTHTLGVGLLIAYWAAGWGIAAEPGNTPAKTKWIPRPLPGIENSNSQADNGASRKTGPLALAGGARTMALGGQPGAARIGLIYRGPGPIGAPIVRAIPVAPRDGFPQRTGYAEQRLREGQFRVIPSNNFNAAVTSDTNP